MKRRYKAGDWFAIPLGAERSAVGIIARACRSRLFVYLFDLEGNVALDRLRTLTPSGALWRGLVGGDGLDDGRWRVTTSSLAFDAERWPFTAFRLRGAFGESWMRREFDETTLRAASTRAASADEVASLPDARFLEAQAVESLLRTRLGAHGDSLPGPYTVCDVRAEGVDESLVPMPHGGRVQLRARLCAGALARLDEFLREYPAATLHLHGSAHLGDVVRLAHLRHLSLDVREVVALDAFELIGARLRTLHLMRAATTIVLEPLRAFVRLETLEIATPVSGAGALAHLPALRRLVLRDDAIESLGALAALRDLRELELVGLRDVCDMMPVEHLESLESLRLRALPSVARLPDWSTLAHLRELEIDALPAITSLGSRSLPSNLDRMVFKRMAQLGVAEVRALLEEARPRRVTVDLGGRRKNREIYRALERGTIAACVP